jgi:hypothetical protein
MKKDFRSISQMYRDMHESAIPKKAEKAVEKSLEKIDDPVEKLEALDGMVKKALGESEAYYAMKRAEKHAAKDGHDFHKLPEYDRGADKPHKEKYREMAAKNQNESVANSATLEFGTDLARDTYAKDTPGQSHGEPPHEPTHAMKAKYGLSVNGVPDKGGSMSKPDFTTTTGIKVEGHDTEAELVEAKEPKNCGCGKDPCETYGKDAKAIEEVSDATKTSYIKKAGKEITNREKLVQKIDNGAWNKGSGGAAIQKQQKAQADKRRAGVRMARGKLGTPSTVKEAMSVTLRKSKSQPGSYKVHSVGSKMKAHGGIKPGERVKDHHIDDLNDSGIKVKYRKEMTEHQKGLIEGKYTDKEVRMAKGIAFDKRHVGGDYTGAAKKMEKIKKGLSDHPTAKSALRRANEQYELAQQLFGQNNLQELSNDLVKKVADKRNVNVSMAGSKADYDRRDPDYQKAANKQHKNQMLRFGRGAKAISKANKTNEAVERRADAKVIMSTDPTTGKKVAKKAPRKEIEIGLGKDA